MSNTDVNSSAVTKGDHRIVVFGAPGHAGCFVMSELERRCMKAVLAGRDAEKLARMADEHPAFEIRVASVDDARSLEETVPRN